MKITDFAKIRQTDNIGLPNIDSRMAVIDNSTFETVSLTDRSLRGLTEMV